MRFQRFKFWLYFLNMMIFLTIRKRIKNDIVQSEIRELGDTHGRCQVTPLDELLNASINEPLDWDPVVNFRKTTTQTGASYEEQLFVMKVYVE